MGNSKTKLEEKQAALEELSRENKAENMQRIRTLKSEINTILHQDELFWRQRSRSIWLPAGDKNTKFFHQRASQWRRKNHISGIQDVDGSWKRSEDQITQVAESYFQDLFTSQNPMNLGGVLDVVDRRFTPKMNTSLLQRYTAEEVRQALFQMHPSKSPGSDGMSPFFFQKFWNIVGNDVTESILSVLNSGHMLRKMNFTHIVLIPKRNDPLVMADYRPISLTNIVSRILSKVMASRLKRVLPNVISEAQSAFVPNRLITDNTTVAYELLHRMRNKRRGKVGQMAVKLDVSKAYDRVEWSFLRGIMLKLGLDHRWVNLAMETVTTASYSILINGEPKGFITPSRGIKQGDPLSPYLYLLCAEGLFALLRKAEESRALKGVLSSQQGVRISHLLFSNDTLLFCQATVDECQRLLDLLGKYEAASGQAINRQKKTLFFSKNTRREVRNDIQQMLGG